MNRCPAFPDLFAQFGKIVYLLCGRKGRSTRVSVVRRLFFLKTGWDGARNAIFFVQMNRIHAKNTKIFNQYALFVKSPWGDLTPVLSWLNKLWEI